MHCSPNQDTAEGFAKKSDKKIDCENEELWAKAEHFEKNSGLSKQDRILNLTHQMMVVIDEGSLRVAFRLHEDDL